VNRKYECILELGGMGVKLLVGYTYHGKVYILHALESTSACLDRGQITDKEALVMAIKEVINTASKSLNFVIDEVSLVLPPLDIKIASKSGYTQTINKDSIVTNFDVENTFMMIKKEVDEEGFKIVDIHPYSFIFDDGTSLSHLSDNIRSNSLKVYADVTLMNMSLYQNFISVVEAANLSIKRCLISSACVIALLSTYNIPQQYVFIDFGGTMTTIAQADQGRLVKTDTLNFGSEDITKNLMSAFNITKKSATHLKEVFGLSEEPGFSFKFKEGYRVRDVTTVIERSLEVLVKFIREFMEKNKIQDFYPILLTGGGANLNNIETHISSIFQTKVIVYTPDFIGARNKSYTNCVACLKYIDLYPTLTEIRKERGITLTRLEKTDDDGEEL